MSHNYLYHPTPAISTRMSFDNFLEQIRHSRPPTLAIADHQPSSQSQTHNNILNGMHNHRLPQDHPIMEGIQNSRFDALPEDLIRKRSASERILSIMRRAKNYSFQTFLREIKEEFEGAFGEEKHLEHWLHEELLTIGALPTTPARPLEYCLLYSSSGFCDNESCRYQHNSEAFLWNRRQ